MSARDILSRVEELIDAEIADRVRNARAEAIKSCAGYVSKRADAIAPVGSRVSGTEERVADVLRDVARVLETMR